MGRPAGNEGFKSYSGFPMLPGVREEKVGMRCLSPARMGHWAYDWGLCRGGVCVSVVFVWSKVVSC